VLEHLEDLKIIRNIPKKSRFIFTVPSFTDPSHVRIYTEDLIRMRLPVEIKEIYRFNWTNGKWEFGGIPSKTYILLVDSVTI